MTDVVHESVPSCLHELDETFLPIDQMRQIARVTRLENGVIEGEVDVGPAHWVYPQHFPGDPIFPGVLLIEADSWSRYGHGRMASAVGLA